MPNRTCPATADSDRERIEELIQSQNWYVLFRGKHCYEWALRIKRDRLGDALILHFQDTSGPAHTYLHLPAKGLFVDCTGVFTTAEKLLGKMWTDAATIETWEPEVLSQTIEARGYAVELAMRIERAALYQFDTNPSFESILPAA